MGKDFACSLAGRAAAQERVPGDLHYLGIASQEPAIEGIFAWVDVDAFYRLTARKAEDKLLRLIVGAVIEQDDGRLLQGAPGLAAAMAGKRAAEAAFQLFRELMA